MPSDECPYCDGVKVVVITRNPTVWMACLCTVDQAKEAA